MTGYENNIVNDRLPVPFSPNRPRVSVLGTGPTGPIGQIVQTGSTGSTGPVGPTNGGIFTLSAQTSTFAQINDGFIFSFGNTPYSNINYGFPIQAACRLTNIGVKLLTPANKNGIIEIYKSGISTNVIIKDILNNA